MRTGAIVFVLSVMLAVAGTLPADALTLNPDLCQGNNTGSCPQNDWPFITASITGSGTLTMTLTASLDADSNQYVQAWWFNLNDAIVPTGAILTITQTGGNLASVDSISSGTSDTSNPYTVTIQQNTFNVDGGGQYDLEFDFENASGPNRFDGTDVLTFTITCSGCTGTLTDAAFDVFASGDPNTPYVGAAGSPHAGQLFTGPFRTIAHIEPAGGFIAGVGARAIPEPGTLILLGAGLVGLAAAVRRKVGR